MSGKRSKNGENPRAHGNRPPGRLYRLGNPHNAGMGGDVTASGLQKLAFFLLIALILYVSFTGAG